MVTMPGGFWYPERQTIQYAVPLEMQRAVSPGDAFGAQFSLPVRCAGAAMNLYLEGPVRFELLDAALTLLRSRDWDVGLRINGPFGVEAPCVEWTAPVDLSTGGPHRLIVTPTGGTSVRCHDWPVPATGPHLGIKVTRVGGVWIEDETRTVSAAIRIDGC